MKIVPIFLLSLPRSGSTLLQRLIATHPAVATASEPWLLLPLFLGFREGHIEANYHQRFLTRAFEDFLERLPDGVETYRAAIRRFADTFYEQLCRSGQTHFLDKTPRYYLIAEDLIHSFPDARWILLWRNPLAVVSSLVDRRKDRWSLYDHRLDLYHGLASLAELQRRYADRLFVLQYESLVEDPDRHLGAIFRYLDLSPIDKPSQRFQDVHLAGRMGDKKGERVFTDVSVSSRDTWVESFTSIPRRIWARHYLHWIGRERLAAAGYDLDQMLAQLSPHAHMEWRQAIPDGVRMCFEALRTLVSRTEAPRAPDSNRRAGHR